MKIYLKCFILLLQVYSSSVGMVTGSRDVGISEGWVKTVNLRSYSLIVACC